MRRLLATFVAVITVAGPVTACSHHGRPASATARASATVRAGSAPTLSVAGVEVVLPDGLTKPATVTFPVPAGTKDDTLTPVVVSTQVQVASTIRVPPRL